MHIHLGENPARYAPCESSKNLLYVSTETLAKFSNMDMNMTLEWVRINKVSVHKCQDETYVTAHSILQFLTEDNDPPMDVDAGLNLLTAKLGHTPRVRPARAGIHVGKPVGCGWQPFRRYRHHQWRQHPQCTGHRYSPGFGAATGYSEHRFCNVPGYSDF